MSLQIGYFNSDGSLNTTGSPAGNNVFNLVQMVVLNYMALHGADALAEFPTLYPARGPNMNNTLGTGTALDPLIAFQPLANASLNGKIGADRIVGPTERSSPLSARRCCLNPGDMRAARRMLRVPTLPAVLARRSPVAPRSVRAARINFHECAPSHTEI